MTPTRILPDIKVSAARIFKSPKRTTMLPTMGRIKTTKEMKLGMKRIKENILFIIISGLNTKKIK
jgi:hypothetical protein